MGWAYYRLGNMEEAVKQLERAIALKPEDPTINDHLGDAYWRVGRMLEARFQWFHARDFKPDPDDLVKIEAKLKSGLPDDTAPEAEHKKPGDGWRAQPHPPASPQRPRWHPRAPRSFGNWGSARTAERQASNDETAVALPPMQHRLR